MALDFSTLFAAGPAVSSTLSGYQYPSSSLGSDQYYSQLSKTMNQMLSQGVPQSQVEAWGSVGNDNYSFANGGQAGGGSGITGSSTSGTLGTLSNILSGSGGLLGAAGPLVNTTAANNAVNSASQAATNFLNVGILGPRLITVVVGIVFVAAGLWLLNSETISNAISGIGSKIKGAGAAAAVAE